MASTEWPPQPPAPCVTQAGWQCPGCRTYYSPEVRQCRCAADSRSLADRIVTPPPVRLGTGTIAFPPDFFPPDVVIQT